MDTNKIREKVAAVRRADDEWDAIPGGYDESEAILKYSTAVNELLAELDAAPKVLTDERPLVWMRMKDHTFVSDRIKNDGERTFQDFTVPLYRNPAAGLTVEEVMEAANKLPFRWDNGGAYVYIGALRTRLTAAIQAKS